MPFRAQNAPHSLNKTQNWRLLWNKHRFKLERYGGIFLLIGSLMLAAKLFGGWGIFGIIIFFAVFALIQLWRGRETYKLGMQNIETQIFGRPLEKDYWEKGELKKKKIKFVLKKPKEER